MKESKKLTDLFIVEIMETKHKCETAKSLIMGLVFLIGIDPFPLDALAKENMVALNRVKRSKMERLTFDCGGVDQTFFSYLTPTG
ncbi:hypothetical protein A6R68_19887, partial [Neotoma lepida]